MLCGSFFSLSSTRAAPERKGCSVTLWKIWQESVSLQSSLRLSVNKVLEPYTFFLCLNA